MFKEIIEEYSLELNLPFNNLVQTCLKHQIELIEKNIWKEKDKSKISELYDSINSLLSN